MITDPAVFNSPEIEYLCPRMSMCSVAVHVFRNNPCLCSGAALERKCSIRNSPCLCSAGARLHTHRLQLPRKHFSWECHHRPVQTLRVVSCCLALRSVIPGDGPGQSLHSETLRQRLRFRLRLGGKNGCGDESIVLRFIVNVGRQGDCALGVYSAIPSTTTLTPTLLPKLDLAVLPVCSTQLPSLRRVWAL
jgi:hypothetical protein